MKKSKIDKLRIHKQHLFIKAVAWLTILTFLITLLFLGFPIVSNASDLSWNIEDRYWTKGLFDQETMRTYISDNFPTVLQNSTFNTIYQVFPVGPIDANDSVVKSIFSSPLDMEGNSTADPTDKGLIVFTIPSDSSHCYVGYGSSFFRVGVGMKSGVKHYYLGFTSTNIYQYGEDGLDWVDYRTLPTFNSAAIEISQIEWCSCPLYLDYPFSNNDINYLYHDNLTGYDASGNGGGYDLPGIDNTYPDGSGGDITNNMYMRSADWKFNIPEYWGNTTNFVQSNPTSNWGKGTVSFSGLINDFQKDNASDFMLKFDFYLNIKGTYDGNTQFGHSYAWRGVVVPLSTFLNNNNYYQSTVENIFTNAVDGTGHNIYSVIDGLRSGQVLQINNFVWTLSCSAHLVSGNYTSGALQESYDFINMSSKDIANNITENNNPYYPPDSNVPDGGNDTSSSNGNGIIVTNNDNDSIIIESNDKQVVDTLYDKLVPPDTETNGGLTERFLALTNANQWFVVMSSALPILGTEFWTTVQTILVTMLGIIGVSFLLWIVVHIL